MQQSESPNAARVLRRVRQHQTILLDFSRVAAEATDLRLLLDIACQQASRATSVGFAKILQYRGDKGDLLMVAGRGWKPGCVGHARFAADMASPPGRAFQTRDLVSIADLAQDPDFRYSNILKDHAIRSLLNAPLAIDGLVWGVLELDSQGANAFDADDERFLSAFSLILALALRHRLTNQAAEQKGVELGKRLSQAETMMLEQNHRVRNYFQMILGLLASRSRKAKTEESRAEYSEIMTRVTAIALAQDLLTIKSGQSVVDAGTYLDALCSGFERTVGEQLKIQRDLEALVMRPERAVPLGLILNELVTNCVKYAAAGRPDAFIGVRFRSDPGANEACLTVQDDGPGMGEERPGSMGLALVRSLAAQLSGRVEVESAGSGTTVAVTFPMVT